MQRNITKVATTVARPGTIVSTILTEDVRVESVAFITDRSYAPGFTTVVRRHDFPSKAREVHAALVAEVSR